MELSEIIALFDLPAGEYTVEPITAGHINQTFKISLDPDQHYILQSISSIAFPDIPLIMANIRAVEEHIRANATSTFSINQIPTLVETKNGNAFVHLTDGTFWRVFNFVDGVSLDKTNNTQQAKEAGRLYGEFLAGLSDLDPSTIGETIKNFHDISFRLKQFDSALLEANPKRLKNAADDILWVNARRDEAIGWYNNITSSESELRVAHYDTKLSNILFNKNDEAIAVIDFDTLMPGYHAFDFGDSVRTICSSTKEDDTDLAATYFDIDLLKSFSHGFVGALKHIISENELNTFKDAVSYMPFIMGLRMLTDYLNNDTYYATKYEQHNLDRCRNQFKLVRSAQDLSTEIINIILE